jgi:hypothetical protein
VDLTSLDAAEKAQMFLMILPTVRAGFEDYREKLRLEFKRMTPLAYQNQREEGN